MCKCWICIHIAFALVYILILQLYDTQWFAWIKQVIWTWKSDMFTLFAWLTSNPYWIAKRQIHMETLSITFKSACIWFVTVIYCLLITDSRFLPCHGINVFFIVPRLLMMNPHGSFQLYWSIDFVFPTVVLSNCIFWVNDLNGIKLQQTNFAGLS